MNGPAPAPPALRDRLNAYFAGAPAELADPYPLFAAAREIAPVLDLGPMSIVTRYADVKEVLRRPDDFGNRALVVGSRVDAARARMEGDALAAFDEVVGFMAHFPSRNDDGDHQRLRRIAHRALTPRRIAALEDVIRGRAETLFEDVDPRRTVDAMEIAYRLPLVVVAELLDVPDADVGTIHRWSTVLGASNASMEPGPFLAARAVLREFRTYVGGMIERHRTAAAPSELVALLMGADQEERLSEVELSALFVQLLFAGHETTTNLIGTGLRDVLARRDQWHLLTEDPARAADAVDELLRFVSPTQFVSRVARHDVVLGDVEIASGTTVLAVLAAAHRDPEIFPDPDRLDITRPERAQHLGFGFGPHFCLGAALARAEAAIVLEGTAERFPRAELAVAEEIWAGGAMLRHLTTLPVRLEPEAVAA